MMKNPLASVIVVLSMGRGYWRSRHDRQAEEALPRCFVADAGQRRSAGGRIDLYNPSLGTLSVT